ncbi:hypothetical protein [Mycobacterium sp. 94-17]|uniref:hypothetical protein n=1 Tax=Mycobacterium sp. 94-17 TaxID=2986147 RepID=UPI002D7A3710|nr:hypothetical protein [Mycobacterium sp. 94-17]
MDAPDGTPARTSRPLDNTIRTDTVGRPRESSISIAETAENLTDITVLLHRADQGPLARNHSSFRGAAILASPTAIGHKHYQRGQVAGYGIGRHLDDAEL